MDWVFLTIIRHKIIEYQNSRERTKNFTENIILRNKNFQTNTEEIKKSKNKLKSEKRMMYQNKLNEVDWIGLESFISC